MKRKVSEIKVKEHVEPVLKKAKTSKPFRGEKFGEVSDIKDKVVKERKDEYFRCMTQNRTRVINQVSEGVWLKQLQRVFVQSSKGKLIQKMGIRGEHKGLKGLFLTPEESLYLVERSLLTIKKNEEGNEIETMQDAFHFLLNESVNMSLNHFIVYSFLKNSGFVSHRHNVNHFPKDAKVKKKVEHVLPVKMRKNLPEKIFEENELNFNGGVEKKVFEKSFVQKTVYNRKQDTEDEKTVLSIPELVEERPLISDLEFPIQDNDEHEMKKIHKVLDIVTEITQEEENEKDGEERFKVVFDVWEEQLNYRNLIEKGICPKFSVIITKYAENFPSMKDVSKICETFDPVPIYFAIIESGHVSFMEIKKYFVPQL